MLSAIRWRFKPNEPNKLNEGYKLKKLYKLYEPNKYNNDKRRIL